MTTAGYGFAKLVPSFEVLIIGLRKKMTLCGFATSPRWL
ncbi:hypothetical protein ANMWB30_22040 [Arthrobacter sp. MWB30]|nr:hypothetical protein ANMWB30_22040 [Arthrobacter sp. MWB30]